MAHKNIPLIDRTSTSTQFNGNLLPVGTASLGTAGAPWATGTIISITGNLTGSAARAIIATTATSASYGLSSSFSSTGASASYAQSASAAISSSRTISSSAALSSSTAISSSYASTYPIVRDGYNEYAVSNTWGSFADTDLNGWTAGTSMVINNVAYLLGGGGSDVTNKSVMTSSLTNPALFTSYPNALPTQSAWNVCARVGNNAYIFGSRPSVVNVAKGFIMSASVNNMLTWSYVGDLPVPLAHQKIVTLNNGQDLWMFGGMTTGYATFTSSMYATASNPTSWSLVPLTGNGVSTNDGFAVVLGNKIYAYGGTNTPNGGDITYTVYTASVSTPTLWGVGVTTMLDQLGNPTSFYLARDSYAVIGNHVYALCSFNAGTPYTNRVGKMHVDAPLSASTLLGILPAGVSQNCVYVAQGKLCSAGGSTGVGTPNGTSTASIVDLGRTAFTSGSGTDISQISQSFPGKTQSNYWTVMPAWPITASYAVSASWAPSGGGLETGSTYPFTASAALSSSTAISSSYASTASFSTSASYATPYLDDLIDVTITSPQLDDLLGWNGVEWINKVGGSVSAGSGVNLYLDDTPAVGGNHTLLYSPSTGSTEDHTASISNETKFIQRFITVDPIVGNLDGGQWTFHTYARQLTGPIVAGTIEIITRINRASELTGSVSLTGSGLYRTASFTGVSPLVASDTGSDASILTSTLIQTPSESFWITQVLNPSRSYCQATDAAYVNETNVTSSLYYYLFKSSTGDIATTTIEAYDTTTFQPQFTLPTGSKIVAAYFAKSNTVAAATVALYHGGTSSYTHITTPLITRHNDLRGLQGGASSEYYHLTQAEYVGTGTGVFVRQINGEITGSLQGTASFATSASRAVSAGTATSATTATNANAISIGVGTNTDPAIYNLLVVTASFVSGYTNLTYPADSKLQFAMQEGRLLVPQIGVSGITASLLIGTSSFATSASYAPSTPTNISAYLSSSWTGSNTSQFAGTASLATNATNAYITSNNLNVDYPVIFAGGVDNQYGLLADNGGITFTSATNTLSVININGSASYALSASYSLSSSYALTASFALSAPMPAPQDLSAYLSASTFNSVVSSSTNLWNGTSSYATVATTALNVATASTALTASYFYKTSGSGAWKIYVQQTYGDLVFDFS